MSEPERKRRRLPADAATGPKKKMASSKMSLDKQVQRAVQAQMSGLGELDEGKKKSDKKKAGKKVGKKSKLLGDYKAPTKAVAAEWGLSAVSEEDRLRKLQAKTSALLSEMVDEAQRQYNDPSICVADDAVHLTVVLPMPSLSLEYLLGNNGLPLGMMIQLVGLPGSCKSGFVCEVGRWFMDLGGIVHLHEHESKYSARWINSIIGWEKRPFMIMPAKSVNEWQQRVTATVARVKAAMKGTAAVPGPGVVFPYLSAVDSILGKPLESTQESIAAEGASGRRFATEAASIKDYMSFLPNQLVEWPFTFIMVNHLKLAKEEGQQQLTRKKQGGSSKEFLETVELQMNKKKDIATVDYEGAELEIQIFKNSMGRGGKRRIPVDVHWWDDEEDGLQRTKFLWNSSTIKFLLAPPDHLKTKLKKALDLTKVANAMKVTSKRLGINEPMDYEEAGAILHADAAVMADLRRVLGIAVNKVYQAGVDYRLQRNLVAAEVGQKIRETC